MAWLTGWGRRKKQTITGTTAGAQTNYQKKMVVHKGSGTDSPTDVYCNGKCRDDFGDIRWTMDDGITLMDYWIEKVVSGDYAVFWIKIPSVPASPGTVDVYMYYDNPSATSLSDGDATFQFFDDFEGTELDTTKWLTDLIGSGSLSVSDGCVWFETGTTNKSKAQINSISETLGFSNVLVEARFMALTQGTHSLDRSFEMILFDDLNTGLYIGHRGSVGDEKVNRKVAGTWGSEITIYSDPPLNVWLRHRIVVYADSILSLLDDSLNILGSYTYSGFVPTINMLYSIGAYNPGSTSNLRSKLDWIFVRKYVDPEPTWGAWGSEELAPVPHSHGYIF